MKVSKDDQKNQGEIGTTGQEEYPGDPHAHVLDGEHIGRSTNFGIEHYGFIGKSEGEEQTK